MNGSTALYVWIALWGVLYALPGVGANKRTVDEDGFPEFSPLGDEDVWLRFNDPDDLALDSGTNKTLNETVTTGVRGTVSNVTGRFGSGMDPSQDGWISLLTGDYEIVNGSVLATENGTVAGRSITGSWSISVWILLPLAEERVSFTLASGNDGRIVLEKTGGDVFIGMTNSSSSQLTNETSVQVVDDPRDGWHHSVVIGDNGTTTFYLDGIALGDPVDFQPMSDIMSVGNKIVCLTKSENCSEDGEPWGVLDDFRLFQRVLTEEEMETLSFNAPPVFLDEALPLAYEGESYEHTLTASDSEGDSFSFLVESMPGWMSFDENDTLSGIPTAKDVGDQTVIMTVQDQSQSTTTSFNVTVNERDDPPTFESSPQTTIEENQLYLYTVIVNDDAVSSFDIATTLPAWLNTTSSCFENCTVERDLEAGELNGTFSFNISGTPTHEDLLLRNPGLVTITVTDEAGTAVQSFNITITEFNDPPRFLNEPANSTITERPFTFLPNVLDEEGDDLTFILINEGDPNILNWMSVNQTTGELSGTPGSNDTGDYDATLIANDGNSNGTLSFSLDVSAQEAPVLTILSAPGEVQEGDAYEAFVFATDGNGDSLEFELFDSPTWLDIVQVNETTARIYGTPHGSDVIPPDQTVHVRVEDGFGGSDSVQFTVHATALEPVPLFVTSPTATQTRIIIGGTFSYEGRVEDTDGPLSISLKDTLGFLSIEVISMTQTSLDFRVFGTPDARHGFNPLVVVQAHDLRYTVSQEFNLDLVIVNTAPEIIGTPQTQLAEEDFYNYTFYIVDPEVDEGIQTYTLELVEHPSWLSMVPSLPYATILGTPDDQDVGVASVQIRASDGISATIQEFTVTVTAIDDPPMYESTPVLFAALGKPYEYTIVVADRDTSVDQLLIFVPVLPDFLDFEDGVISGTPSQTGTFTVKVTAADLTTTIHQDFSIQVSPENAAPVIHSTPNTTATEHIAYSYEIVATDLEEDTLTFDAETIPEAPWLSLDMEARLLFGTPGHGDGGDYAIRVNVSDGTVITTQEFTLSVVEVNDAPVFVFSDVPAVTIVDQLYTYNFTATDEETAGSELEYVVTITPPNMWLSRDLRSKILGGTPALSDLFGGDSTSVDVTISVTDKVYQGMDAVTVEQHFTITVYRENTAPEFTSVPPTSATLNQLYSYTPIVTDRENNEVAFTAPTLPTFLEITDGVLSGTPTEAGSFSVVLRATEVDGTLQAQQSFLIEVPEATNGAPVFTSQPPAGVVVGRLFTYTVTATDPENDSLTFTVPAKPDWLTFNVSILSGTPEASDVGGNNVVRVDVSDGNATTPQVFSIDVVAENGPPTFTSATVVDVLEDETVAYVLTAEDPQDDAITFGLVTESLPRWLQYNTETAVMTVAPLEEDFPIEGPAIRTLISFSVTFSASDWMSTTNHTVLFQASWVNDPPVLLKVPRPSAFVSGCTTPSCAYTYLLTIDDEEMERLSAPAISITAALTHRPTWHGDFGGLVNPTITPTTYTPGSVPLLIGNPGPQDVDTDVPFEVTITDVGQGQTVVMKKRFEVTVWDVNGPPVFTSVPILTAREDQEYTYTVTVTDAQTDQVITLTVKELPSWLSFNPVTHVVSGTPIDADLALVSDFDVEIEASDSGQVDDTGVQTVVNASATQAFTIHVTRVNESPRFNSTCPTSVQEDTAYSCTVSVLDEEDSSVTLVLAIGPDWLHLSNNTLSGTPSQTDCMSGEQTVRLNATDTGGLTVQQTFAIEVVCVDDPPHITSVAPSEGIAGSLFEYFVFASDVDTDVGDLIWTTPLRPSWMSPIDTDDPFRVKLAGVVPTPSPTDAHIENHFVVQVQDQSGNTDVQDVELNIIVLGDDTPPLPGTVTATYVPPKTMKVTWDDFEDPEAGIVRYEVGFGTVENVDNLVHFLDHRVGLQENATLTIPTPTCGEVYYTMVKAVGGSPMSATTVSVRQLLEDDCEFVVGPSASGNYSVVSLATPISLTIPEGAFSTTGTATLKFTALDGDVTELPTVNQRPTRFLHTRFTLEGKQDFQKPVVLSLDLLKELPFTSGSSKIADLWTYDGSNERWIRASSTCTGTDFKSDWDAVSSTLEVNICALVSKVTGTRKRAVLADITAEFIVLESDIRLNEDVSDSGVTAAQVLGAVVACILVGGFIIRWRAMRREKARIRDEKTTVKTPLVAKTQPARAQPPPKASAPPPRPPPSKGPVREEKEMEMVEVGQKRRSARELYDRHRKERGDSQANLLDMRDDSGMELRGYASSGAEDAGRRSSGEVPRRPKSTEPGASTVYLPRGSAAALAGRAVEAPPAPFQPEPEARRYYSAEEGAGVGETRTRSERVRQALERRRSKEVQAGGEVPPPPAEQAPPPQPPQARRSSSRVQEALARRRQAHQGQGQGQGQLQTPGTFNAGDQSPVSRERLAGIHGHRGLDSHTGQHPPRPDHH